MERNIALDALKLLMAFMVVGLHSRFLDEYTALGSYLSVNGVFRIAVPVFFIINGFYFFYAIEKNKQFAWLKKAFILYVVWMLFYSPFWFSLADFSVKELLKLFQQIIIGYFHLWYVPGMIGAAIILLLLRNFSFWILCLSIILTFSLGVFIQYAGNYHLYQGSTLDTLFNYYWFHRNFLLFAYPFFCIGYLINKYSLNERIPFYLVTLLTFIGLFFLIIESYINFYYHESRYRGFDNLLSLILLCPNIFLLFMKIDVRSSSKSIALYASAVYFIHAFILMVFRGFTDFNGTMLTISVFIVSVFVSFFIIKINRKLRFIL